VDTFFRAFCGNSTHFLHPAALFKAKYRGLKKILKFFNFVVHIWVAPNASLYEQSAHRMNIRANIEPGVRVECLQSQVRGAPGARETGFSASSGRPF
jgi:hypothetical protein